MMETDAETLGFEPSNTDKVLFPGDGITKGDLIDYYRRIWPHAGRHYRDRPLSMHRYPDGIEADGFFQKNAPDHFPDWIDRAEMRKEDGTVSHVIANDARTLAYLADKGCITPHLALSRRDRPDHPDRLIFDLDPSDDDFAKVQEAAGLLRDRMEARGLHPFVQTTGSRGLHLVVALDRSAGFDAVRAFARAIAQAVAEEHPALTTVEMRKKDRGDRVFLDIARNAYGQTSVAPLAVRARPHAPVAMPLRWEEALSADMRPDRYTIASAFRRLAQVDDPWQALDEAPAAAAELEAGSG